MNIYTFILDFRGGTYLHQAKAENKDEALELWANQLPTSQILHIGQASKQKLIESLPDIKKELVSIESLRNVWFFDFLFKTGYAVIHIIKTSM